MYRNKVSTDEVIMIYCGKTQNISISCTMWNTNYLYGVKNPMVSFEIEWKFDVLLNL